MNYLVTKQNPRGTETDIFISSVYLAETFKKNQKHVDLKIKAIMYVDGDDVINKPFKVGKNNMSVYLEYGDNSKLNIFCNEELTKYLCNDWNTKHNKDSISTILNDFRKKKQEDTGKIAIEEQYHMDVEIYENIQRGNDYDIEDNIQIKIFDYEGKQSLYITELFNSLKLYELFKYEKWIRLNLLENPISYIENMDYVAVEVMGDINNAYCTDYIISLDMARELIATNITKRSSAIRNYLIGHSEKPISIDINIEEDFIKNLKLNIYYIERYLPSILTWKNAEILMPKLLEKCMEEIDSGNIKVEVVSAVIRTALKIVELETNTTKKELLNKEITSWMIKRAQIYSGLISAVKTENTKLKEQLNMI